MLSEFLPVLEKLVSDDQDQVRVLAVKSLKDFSQNLDPQQNRLKILPLILVAAEDRAWKVRMVLAEIFQEVKSAGRSGGLTEIETIIPNLPKFLFFFLPVHRIFREGGCRGSADSPLREAAGRPRGGGCNRGTEGPTELPEDGPEGPYRPNFSEHVGRSGEPDGKHAGRDNKHSELSAPVAEARARVDSAG